MSTSNEAGDSHLLFDINKDVLSTKGFPLTCVLRTHSTHKCVCVDESTHKDIFAFNNTIGCKLFQGKIKQIPEGIKTCWNTLSLFEDKLPRELLYPKLGKKSSKEDIEKNRPRRLFEELSSVQQAINVLFKGTYWCHRVCKTGQTLLKIYQLLSQDFTSWNKSYLGRKKLSQKGVGHLRNILSTIDGMATQIVLAFPDVPQIQNWEYFDNMSNCMFKNLLDDWAVKHDSNYISYYERIKSIRGQIKQVAFNQQGSMDSIDIGRDMTFLRLPLSNMRGKNIITMFRVSLMIQTRGCGTPPPHVFLKTFRKFRETVTTPSPPPKREVASKIAFATKVVYERIVLRPGVGRNLPIEIGKALTKAKISLSDSAELETPHNEGGKYEAFRKYNQSISGKPVYMVDLENGQETKELIPDELDYMGTRVFHHAFNEAINGRITDLMTVRTHGVSEPGKVREITVSHLLHAVLLHPISHILCDILALVPSSATGMKAANHAFEFYKRLNNHNPNGSFILNEDDIWVLSTDLETATDYANPYIVRVILQVLLGKHCLGIPSLYKTLVLSLLTEPRLIIDTSTNEEFWTTRGCLMGDPVTKPVMHLLHLVGKEITKSLFERRT